MQNPNAIWWNVVVIQSVAGVVGIFSLSNARHKHLMKVGDGAWVLLMFGVVAAIALPWLLRWLFQDFKDGQIWVLRGAAIFDLGLLFFLLRYTGGPAESWFTPFLLAIAPLGVQLEPEKGIGLWWYLVGPGYVFATQLDLPLLDGVPLAQWHGLVQPLHRSNLDNNRLYHWWYFMSALFTVFFPAMVKGEIIQEGLKRLKG